MTDYKPDIELTKYRIPTIEEFVDGFKYEVYSEGYDDCIEDFCGWYYYKVGGTCWRSLSDIQRELNNGNIRVRL